MLCIANAGHLANYVMLYAELRERVEDVILARLSDATERLLEIAERYKGEAGTRRAADLSWREWPVTKRLEHTLVQGIDQYIIEDTEAARIELERPLAVIAGPLVAGMKVVGDLLGAGRMLSPQAVNWW